MSNFLTLSQVSGGLTGTAPRLFTASTNDDLAAITATGYVDDLVANGNMNRRDIIFVTYDVDGTPGQGTYFISDTNSLDPYLGVGLDTSIRGLIGVKSSGTSTFGGGSVSNSFAATGVAPTDVVVASNLTIGNANVAINKVTPATNSITVTWTADPGAGTAVQWVAIGTAV